ncbi:MAG: hypothetical protein AVDCRST_MAG22-684, partial [uncultured Rubrobacteraceae bacterium]
ARMLRERPGPRRLPGGRARARLDHGEGGGGASRRPAGRRRAHRHALPLRRRHAREPDELYPGPADTRRLRHGVGRGDTERQLQGHLRL